MNIDEPRQANMQIQNQAKMKQKKHQILDNGRINSDIPYTLQNQCHMSVLLDLQSFKRHEFLSSMQPYQHFPLAPKPFSLGSSAISNNFMVVLHLFLFSSSTTPTYLSTLFSLELSHG
jgi:hypothetical protein